MGPTVTAGKMDLTLKVIYIRTMISKQSEAKQPTNPKTAYKELIGTGLTMILFGFTIHSSVNVIWTLRRARTFIIGRPNIMMRFVPTGLRFI